VNKISAMEITEEVKKAVWEEIKRIVKAKCHANHLQG